MWAMEKRTEKIEEHSLTFVSDLFPEASETLSVLADISSFFKF